MAFSRKIAGKLLNAISLTFTGVIVLAVIVVRVE
jgi:hypothetical protein